MAHFKWLMCYLVCLLEWKHFSCRPHLIAESLRLIIVSACSTRLSLLLLRVIVVIGLRFNYWLKGKILAYIQINFI
jgi:hypothetical protein